MQNVQNLNIFKINFDEKIKSRDREKNEIYFFINEAIMKNEEIIDIQNELQEILHDIPHEHGFHHAMMVLSHIDKALKHVNVSKETSFAIRLAALLHDVDDHKIFTTENYANARYLMRNIPSKISESTIEMIELVSFSKNKNSLCNEELKLYPRYADRLEAIGHVGIQRCYQYCNSIGTPMYTDKTPRFTKVEDVMKEAKSRILNYSGKSESMMDHFYDKLLNIGDGIQTENPYFIEERNKRMNILLSFVLEFSKNGYICLS